MRDSTRTTQMIDPLPSLPRVSTPALALRSLAGGFVLAAALVAGVAHLDAQTVAKHNSNAPVNFGADRMELQDKQKRVVLTGNVDITQEDLRLQAARTTLAYTDASTVQVQRIDAAGGVVVTRGDQRASGNSAVYDLPRKIITMVGNVALRRGKDTLNGGRLVIDLNTGLSTVDGRGSGSAGGSGTGTGTTTTSSGRVTGTFNVAKKAS